LCDGGSVYVNPPIGEVKSSKHRQNVEKLIRGNKTDIVGSSHIVLETEKMQE